jgi:hypothetical protein
MLNLLAHMLGESCEVGTSLSIGAQTTVGRRTGRITHRRRQRLDLKMVRCLAAARAAIPFRPYFQTF